MSVKDIFDINSSHPVKSPRAIRGSVPEELDRCMRFHCVRCNRCQRRRKQCLKS